MIKLALILVGIVALGATSCVEAYSQQENLNFINMIVSLLNNREKCTIPTYGEIDEVSKRLDELKKEWGLDGADFDLRLSADQKILRQTVLDQWDSFQKYLTSENVLKGAKKRSFLGKVERYQEQKFGESICTRKPDTKVLDDPEFEKNPLVRYVKQFGPAGKPSSSGNGEISGNSNSGGSASDANFDDDVELKFKVHQRDESGNIQSSKNYVTRFNFDKSRPQNRITLHIGDRK